MKAHTFREVSNTLRGAASLMWQKVIATCPDEHLQPDLAEVRTVARDWAKAHNVTFNRIVRESPWYGFYLDDSPVLVIERKPDEFKIHYNPGEAS